MVGWFTSIGVRTELMYGYHLGEGGMNSSERRGGGEANGNGMRACTRTRTLPTNQLYRQESFKAIRRAVGRVVSTAEASNTRL